MAKYTKWRKVIPEGGKYGIFITIFAMFSIVVRWLIAGSFVLDAHAEAAFYSLQ